MAEQVADGQEICPDGDHDWKRWPPEPDVGIMSGYLECKKCGFQKDDDGELDPDPSDNYF